MKDKHVKDFLTKYYDGNPTMECPVGCKSDCQLDCYIEIHQALVDDEGNVTDFKTPYVRDGQDHCCGLPMQTLDNHNIYCIVCGEEYEN